MTVPSTFSELVDLVADYGHRGDLTSQIGDTFIPFASIRIGQALKSIDNEKVETLNPSDNPFDVPADFGSIRSLEYLEARGPRTLKATGRHDINRFSSLAGTGGFPIVYNVIGRQFDARPFISGEFSVNYYAIPTLDGSNPTNAVLDSYPNLYLYAALIEFHSWTQDKEQRDIAVGVFNSEVGNINRNSERARYDAPAQIGV